MKRPKCFGYLTLKKKLCRDLITSIQSYLYRSIMSFWQRQRFPRLACSFVSLRMLYRSESQVTRVKLKRSDNLPLKEKIQNDQEHQDFDGSPFEKYGEENGEESSPSYKKEGLHLPNVSGEEQKPSQGLD